MFSHSDADHLDGPITRETERQRQRNGIVDRTGRRQREMRYTHKNRRNETKEGGVSRVGHQHQYYTTM